MESARSITGDEGVAAACDSRCTARAPLVAAVELCLAGQRQRAQTRDVSPSGLGISLRPDGRCGFVSGRRVDVEFALPGIAPPVAIEAEIVWHDTESGRLGVLFRELDPGLRALLDAFSTGRL